MNRPIELQSQPYDSVDDAQVLPALVKPNGQLEMGVFTDRGECRSGSLLQRSTADVSTPGTPLSDPHHIDQEVIYAGPLLNHFGHFILESLGRLSVARKYSDLPIVWACRVLPDLNKEQLGARARLLPFQKTILDYLGIKNDIRFVTRPTSFSNVLIPESGYRISDHFTEAHKQFLGIEQYRPEAGKKIWLSRSRMKNLLEIGELNSTAIERRMHNRGWTIYHPQEHCFKSQIRELATAERIAGFEGSALHNVIFIRDCGNLQVDIVTRRRRINPNYLNIAKAKKFNQSVHVAAERSIVNAKGAHTISCSPKPDLLAADIDQHDTQIRSSESTGNQNLHGLVTELAVTQKRTNLLIIGLADVRGWESMNVTRATYVNKFFVHPYANLEGVSNRYYEIPAEFYLAYCHGKTSNTNLIAIRGDTAEEVFCRFQIAYRHYSQPTLWILNLASSQTETVKLYDNVASLGDDEKLYVLLQNFPALIDIRTIRSDSDTSFVVHTVCNQNITRRMQEVDAYIYFNYFDGISTNTRQLDSKFSEILDWVEQHQAVTTDMLVC